MQKCMKSNVHFSYQLFPISGTDACEKDLCLLTSLSSYNGYRTEVSELPSFSGGQRLYDTKPKIRLFLVPPVNLLCVCVWGGKMWGFFRWQTNIPMEGPISQRTWNWKVKLKLVYSSRNEKLFLKNCVIIWKKVSVGAFTHSLMHFSYCILSVVLGQLNTK